MFLTCPRTCAAAIRDGVRALGPDGRLSRRREPKLAVNGVCGVCTETDVDVIVDEEG